MIGNNGYFITRGLVAATDSRLGFPEADSRN